MIEYDLIQEEADPLELNLNLIDLVFPPRRYSYSHTALVWMCNTLAGKHCSFQLRLPVGPFDRSFASDRSESLSEAASRKISKQPNKTAEQIAIPIIKSGNALLVPRTIAPAKIVPKLASTSVLVKIHEARM